MEHWRSFASIVEHSSLNQASRNLNLSQPALSRQIMKLEETLGVALFTRKGKRLELTRAGEICYEHAKQLHAMDVKLMRQLQQFKVENKHVALTVGASLTTLQSTLPQLLAAFLDEHPHTDIKVLTGKTHEIVTMVKEKKVDIGLIASTINVSGIQCEPLFDDHLCLVLPPDHDYVHQAELTINHLEGLSMILFSRGTWYRILTDELFQQYSIHPDIKMEIDSFEAIIRLVPSCYSATLLPQSYVRSLLAENNGLVVRNLPELLQTKRTTSLIYAKEAYNQEAVHPFINKAKAFYENQTQSTKGSRKKG
ncbi:LysR family transcriptional regulator [Paenibacillus sp. N1-5-1-14]|uniref:LysR family transcriptional regulator n=1 Tax=Paenibacillus radicibacter TaxID=2972488 RepID=UPI002158CAE2|nr:LysR family transcriptional regulator [Paenibacillus radicibacter]MCR8645245.1 LysR family transcriptional regulator [Paenibacillus radicibacter]